MNQAKGTSLPREEHMFSPTNFMGEYSEEKQEKESEKRKTEKEDSNKWNTSHPEANVRVEPEKSLLPVGEEMNSVGGVIVCKENVGDALQFSEFCSVFGKILNLKKTRAADVLRDIFHGRKGRRGKFSETAKFHIEMLSIIKNDRGEDFTRPQASGENSWFNVLKECFSESRSVLKSHGLDILDNLADYESLNPSQKLKLLNILCDEIIATKRVRNWMDKQCEEVAKSEKEAKEKLTAAKQEEKKLKQKIRNEIAQAIIAKNGAALSASEREVIFSRYKSETEKAKANVLNLNSRVNFEKNKKQPDAVRLEPILQVHGFSYWKSNVSGKNDFLCQMTETGDNPLTLDDKWSTINDEEKEIIEKHISAASSCSSSSSSRGNS